MEENGDPSIVARFALFCNFITNKTRSQYISTFTFKFKSEFQFPVPLDITLISNVKASLICCILKITSAANHRFYSLTQFHDKIPVLYPLKMSENL